MEKEKAQPNPNPTPSLPTGHREGEQDKNSEEQDPYLFYNVMPKNTDHSGIVAPTVTVVETQEGVREESAQSFLKKYKKYFFMVGGIVLLAIPGWFAYNYFSNPYKDNAVVVHAPMQQASHTAATSTSAGTQQGTAITKEWLKKYFGSETCQDQALCGDNADPDRDGLTNLQEFRLGTDPNNADSDGDGLADGDEANVFHSNPLDARTAKDPKYTDADFIKGLYSIKSNQKLTKDELAAMAQDMQKFGLHQPTIATLGIDFLVKNFNFTPAAGTNATTTPATGVFPASGGSGTAASSSIDQSPAAKQDRDAQRTSTIKTIGIALVKYQQDHQTFPATANFSEMVTAIKAYNRVATNPVDPINKDPYVYAYVAEKNNTDFTLSFYSETVAQLIKKHAADALSDKNATEASGFDDERKSALEELRSALLLYSNNNAAGNQSYTFPTAQKYKSSIVPQYISSLPKDPTTNADYEYKVSDTFDAFTLKAILQKPPVGNTGYLCNQEECRYY